MVDENGLPRAAIVGEEDGGHIYGRGASDMKAGVAAMMALLGAADVGARGVVSAVNVPQRFALLSVAVSAVCSLEPQEGEEVVTAFLESRPGFRIAAPEPGALPDFVTPSPEGWVRILPGLVEDRGGLDGFFVARLVRAGD